MLNSVNLVGRLVRDPELKYTSNGIATCSMTLAVNRPFANQQGEREADFISVVVWRKQGENAANYLRKGSLAGVTGRIQTRNYENSEGEKVYITEVVADTVSFLDSKGKGQGGAEKHPNGALNTNNDPFSQDGTPIDIQDSDLPF